MREYLSVEQLTELTPWSAEAIKAMVRRRLFVHGVHYFQPSGPGTRLVFKWSAIVAFVEGNANSEGQKSPVIEKGSAVVSLANGRVIDVEEATERAHRMLG